MKQQSKNKIKLLSFITATFLVASLIVTSGYFYFKSKNKYNFVFSLTKYVKLHKNDINPIGLSLVNEYYDWISPSMTDEVITDHNLTKGDSSIDITTNIDSKVYIVESGKTLTISPSSDIHISNTIILGRVEIYSSNKITINNSLINNATSLPLDASIHNSLVYGFNTTATYIGNTSNSLIGAKYKEKGESVPSFIDEPSYWDK
ncbi:MAG: hypothetical protein HRS50_02110 [Mycoplasmataceae bacterium]|nr:hypothetical protein [Mycoplasmataceae bacterium]